MQIKYDSNRIFKIIPLIIDINDNFMPFVQTENYSNFKITYHFL